MLRVCAELQSGSRPRLMRAPNANHLVGMVPGAEAAAGMAAAGMAAPLAAGALPGTAARSRMLLPSDGARPATLLDM